jgi:hypothetical protein
VLLHGQVRVAFVIKDVLAHVVGCGKALRHVAELQRDVLVDISFFGVGVDLRVLVFQRLVDRHQRRQRLVLDDNVFQGRLGRLLVNRRHGSHRVAHHAHLFAAQRFFILAHGQDAVLNGQIFARNHGQHPRPFQRPRHVDVADQGVRVRAAQQLSIGHTRQNNVVGEHRLAHDLAHGVHLHPRLAYNFQFIPSVSHISNLQRSPPQSPISNHQSTTPTSRRCT